MFKYFYDFFNKVKSKLSQKGQGMVEYALILAAVAILAGVVLANGGGLRTAIESAFDNVKTQIEGATTKVNTTSGSTSTGGGAAGGTNP